MTVKKKAQRFVFETQGVCPPEIHFQIHRNLLEDIRFVGGGCPGNAQLVSRLIKGRPIGEVKPYLDGITCRNGTSCAQQLHLALKLAENGRLSPIDSFRVHRDSIRRNRIGFIAGLNGDIRALEILLKEKADDTLDAIYCLGNLTGQFPHNKQLLRLIRQKKIPVLLGETDWQLTQGLEVEGLPHLEQKEKDWMVQFPHVINFGMEAKTGMAFFGDYIQKLPGYSDFDPFALEMNMVCGLTNFMRDETVFPALEAMIPQFQADIIIFSQVLQWGHWHVGGKDFISMGPARNDKCLNWGLLKIESGSVHFEIRESSVQGG